MKINIFLFLSILLFSATLQAKPITLINEKEIHRANQLGSAIDALSEKVMTCIHTYHDSNTSCTCPNLESCKFKSEFKKNASLYCNLKSDFPNWINRHLIYSVKGGNITHSLSMEVLEGIYGKHCA